MKSISVFLLFLVSAIGLSAQIHSEAFGKSTDPAIIFLHGGPGYNAVNFERTTAKNLAESGFYVIVYDRRGEGRSGEEGAAYTFDQTFDDINDLYQQYGIQKASLIGHSFGGLVATLYAKKNRKKINSIILVGAPVSLQETFKTIMRTSKKIYEEKGDSTNLKYIKMLEEMNPRSLQYSSYNFMHAMQNGFYSPEKPTDEAIGIYNAFKTDSVLMKYAGHSTFEAVKGFYLHEKYTSVELEENLRKLVAKKLPIYGLYGKEDGLYSKAQVDELKDIIGEGRLKYLENCSHNVFIDQQSIFIQSLEEWAK